LARMDYEGHFALNPRTQRGDLKHSFDSNHGLTPVHAAEPAVPAAAHAFDAGPAGHVNRGEEIGAGGLRPVEFHYQQYPGRHVKRISLTRGGGTLASVPYVLSPGPDRLRLQ